MFKIITTPEEATLDQNDSSPIWTPLSSQCVKFVCRGRERLPNPKAKRLKWHVKAQIWADRATMWPHARLRAKTNWNARIELFPHRENTELNWQHIEYIFYQTFGADIFQTEISSFIHREILWKAENIEGDFTFTLFLVGPTSDLHLGEFCM